MLTEKKNSLKKCSPIFHYPPPDHFPDLFYIFCWSSLNINCISGVLRFPDADAGVRPKGAGDRRGGPSSSLPQRHLAHSCNLYLNTMFNYKYRYLYLNIHV